MEGEITKPISKSELATLWGIHQGTLRNWINSNKDLLAQLYSSGYKDNQRLFTIKQYKIINTYFS